jgi:hypothetical protein
MLKNTLNLVYGFAVAFLKCLIFIIHCFPQSHIKVVTFLMAEMRRQTIENFGKDIEQLEWSCDGGASIEWFNYFGKLLGNMYKVNIYKTHNLPFHA